MQTRPLDLDLKVKNKCSSNSNTLHIIMMHIATFFIKCSTANVKKIHPTLMAQNRRQLMLLHRILCCQPNQQKRVDSNRIKTLKVVIVIANMKDCRIERLKQKSEKEQMGNTMLCVCTMYFTCSQSDIFTEQDAIYKQDSPHTYDDLNTMDCIQS